MMSYDGLYLFKISSRTGSISSLYELTGINLADFYVLWNTKFISDNVFFTIFDNDDGTFYVVYDFSSHDYYYYGWADYETNQNTMSPIVDEDKLVIIGGDNYNDGCSAIELDYDKGRFFGRVFTYDDGDISALTSLSSSFIAISDFSDTFSSLVTASASLDSLDEADLTYNEDTDEIVTSVTRSYPHDSDIYLTVEPGYVGYSGQLSYNCYASEFRGVTYKPVTSTIALFDYSSYTDWMGFDTENVQFYFMEAEEGEYEFTLDVTYETDKWTVSKTVYLTVEASDSNCVGVLTDTGCILVFIFTAIVIILILLVVALIIVKILRSKSRQVDPIEDNKVSESMDRPIADEFETGGNTANQNGGNKP